MGKKNYLIDGISGTGKTTVANELDKLGYHVVHGDRELKYQGDPKTGKPVVEPRHKTEMQKTIWLQNHLLWDFKKVKSIISDHTKNMSFFCGGSRNSEEFIDLFDGVFVLHVEDINVINQRLDQRTAIDPTDWGAKPEEKELIAKLHATQADIAKSDFIINATEPVERVVEQILKKCT